MVHAVPQRHDVPTTADGFIIRAVDRATQGNLTGALADLNQANQIRPEDFATLQIRGVINAQVEENQQAVQDLEGRADGSDILLIRHMCHLKLGNIEQSLADVVQLDTAWPGFAVLLYQKLEHFLRRAVAELGNVRKEATVEYDKRLSYVSYVRALMSAIKAREQSASKVSRLHSALSSSINGRIDTYRIQM